LRNTIWMYRIAAFIVCDSKLCVETVDAKNVNSYKTRLNLTLLAAKMHLYGQILVKTRAVH